MIDGMLIKYEIISLFRDENIELNEHSNKKNNYNPYKKGKDDFIISDEKLNKE